MEQVATELVDWSVKICSKLSVTQLFIDAYGRPHQPVLNIFDTELVRILSRETLKMT